MYQLPVSVDQFLTAFIIIVTTIVALALFRDGKRLIKQMLPLPVRMRGKRYYGKSRK